MRTVIKRIQRELGITTVFVTHDQEECFSISDRVAVMDKGKIVQCDTPETIYHHPADEMVARFVGFKNFYPASVYRELGARLQGEALSCTRPQDISIVQGGAGLEGKIDVRTYLGNSYQYEVATRLGAFTVVSTQEPPLAVDVPVSLSVKDEKVVCLGA